MVSETMCYCGKPRAVVNKGCVYHVAREVGELWIDRHGDVWSPGDDGLMHSYETAPFTREHVEKKWGPLRRLTPATNPPIRDGA